MRDRSADSNVIQFPGGARVQLEQAISQFDEGDHSYQLFEKFSKLAQQGLKEASFFIGCMYEDGSNGLSKDLENALSHYENAIEGFGYLEAYLAAARLLYHGDELPQDFKRVYSYYLHIAKSKNHPVALFMLGRMYHRGEGVEKDFSIARSWYDQAILTGSVYGMLNLAMLEADEGKMLKSIRLRACAGINAFLIAKRNAKDVRLRGG